VYKALFPALAIFAVASVAVGATPKKSAKHHHRTATAAVPATNGKTTKTAAHHKGKTAKRPSRYYQQAPSPERYKEIQQALASKGYFQGEPTGAWGPDSVEALKRFQTDQSLNPDGKIGSLSLIALGLGPKKLTAKSDSAPSAGTPASPTPTPPQ
jgi:peptidoglycan hydrolase-like protein with peptidoglycan-binding domain